jgi:RNA polymerase sigma factor (sigma-70 family)
MTLNTTDGGCRKPFLEEFLQDGGSIDRIYEHPKFRKKLRGFCYRFHFRVFKGAYGPEDLYQDTCVKVWKSRFELLRPGNIMTERDFFGWLFVVTRNQFYSRLREFKRLRRSGLSFDDTSVEDLDVAAPDEDHEAGDIFKYFLEFIEQYPEGCRHMIKLWLEDYSFREIAEKLRDTPFACSHVTVRNWVTAAIDAFKVSLGVKPPETAAPSTGTTKKRVRVRNFQQSIAG